MATIASSTYLKSRLPFVEQSKDGAKHKFILYELNPPDKLIALLKENKYAIRVSGYASEDQWEGYKLEIVNLQPAEHEKGISFLLQDNNLFIKGYPLTHGDTNIVFFKDSESA